MLMKIFKKQNCGLCNEFLFGRSYILIKNGVFLASESSFSNINIKNPN